MVVRAPLDLYWKWGELDLHNQQYRFVIKSFIRAEVYNGCGRKTNFNAVF